MTDAETIRVVQSTLAGEINPDIVRLINAPGALAAGINGLDGNLFRARARDETLGRFRQFHKSRVCVNFDQSRR